MKIRSCVLGVADHFALDLGPIDIPINLLVDFTTDHHVVSADQIQPVLDFGRKIIFVWGADDALNGIGEDQVGHLIGGQKITDESAAVDGEDQNLL